MKEVKGIGFVSTSVNIYQLRADGTRERVKDWSDKGRENVSKAVIKNFKEKSAEMKPLNLEGDDIDLMEAVHTRYESVCEGIYSTTTASVYSVGYVEDITTKYGVDSLLFVDADDEISAAGREAAGFMKDVASSAASVATGVVVPMYLQRHGITVICIGLVDKSGLILWHRCLKQEGGYDLRDAESAAKFIKIGISDFPK